ncbi:MAG: enolase C-terminal domain-like protein [Bdellovibrionales bacterium]
MKIFYSLYELQPKNLEPTGKAPAKRKGALLKVHWDDKRVGFSDLHPWPELGDPEIEEHLSLLRQKKLSAMMEQCIWLASLDEKGRSEKRNIYDNSLLLKNNAMMGKINPHTVELLDPLVKQGFKVVKIKLGDQFDNEVQMINRMALTHDVKLRLDFNGRLSWNTFSQFLLKLSPHAKRMIEYIEDPFPYDEALWKEARQIIPLAIDWELRKIPLKQEARVEADIFILKPTHQDIAARMNQVVKWNKKATVTSHMGHPLGVMQCAVVAQDLQRQYPNYMNEPGCLTFDYYEPTEFNSLLNLQGPYIKKIGGWGIGFDFVLKGQEWNLLKIP